MRTARPRGLLVLGVATVVALALAHRDEIREPRRGSPRPWHARPRGRAGAWLRPRRGRRDRRSTVEDFRRAGLSHLLAVSRPERGPARPAGDATARGARHAAAHAPRLDPRRDRRLCAAGRRRPVDPARRGDGWAQPARDAGRAARLAPLRRSRWRQSSPWRSTRESAPTSAGSSALPQCSASSLLASPLRAAIASPDRHRRLARRACRGRRDDDRRHPGDGAADRLSLRSVSTTTLVANLLALPAVAPAMWLGMLAAVAGQVPGFPVAPLNAVDGSAARLHRPGRRLVRPAELGLSGPRLDLDRPGRRLPDSGRSLPRPAGPYPPSSHCNPAAGKCPARSPA